MSPIIPVENQGSQEETVICDNASRLSASFAKSASLDATRGATSNVVYKCGNVLRLDFPMPFFLRNDVFDSFRMLDYSWNTDKTMVLFLDNAGSSARYSAPPVAPTATTGRKPDDYSIGGCPLECPFDLNEDFEEALFIDILPTVFNPLNIPIKFSPLEIDNGRLALRQAIVQHEPFVQEMNLMKTSSGWPEKNCPVFSLVDCSDQDKPLVLTGFKNDDAAINVHLMGRFRPDAEILDVKTFKGYHDTNLFTFDNRPSTSVAHAVYEKLHGEYPSRGNVYLEFLFNEPASIFDLPPEDSQCKIAIRPLAGDANPSMKSLWSEVESLEKWISLLAFSATDVGEASYSANGSVLNCTTYDVSEDKMTENIKAVQELLAQEPAIDLHRASSIEFSDSLDQVLQRVAKQERADFDFTDRVWAIVRSCESIDELQECLLLIFKSVANKMYRPYLLLSNTTTMAKNLTAVMKGEMSYFKMRHPQTMIKLIVECGLRKLFQDYNFALAISHLIERGEVDHWTPSISDIPNSVNNLKRLHCILEIMCLSKERLTLSVNIQQGHVKKMLKSFSECPSNLSFRWDKIYHFDVLPNDIRRVMSGLHPFYFKVKIDSKTLLKWATTTVVVSTERYINHKKNSGDDIHSRLYYVYLICESGRLME